ncbi:hypothetical protein [Neorhizobium sp. NCHU2750]
MDIPENQNAAHGAAAALSPFTWGKSTKVMKTRQFECHFSRNFGRPKL